MARRTARIVRPYVVGATLDVGAGRCAVAEHLKHDPIICLDIARHPRCEREPVLFDGGRIPYGDQSFETVLCTFVLHHADDPLALILEMKRVGRRVVVLEDDVDQPIRRWSVLLMHELMRRAEGMPYRVDGFRTLPAWIESFAACGLSLRLTRRCRAVHPLWPFLRHHLFVLDPDQAASALKTSS